MILIFIILQACTLAGTNHITIPQKDTDEKVLPGAYQTEEYIPMLKGKSVAVVGNQTSTIEGTHLVDSLLKRGVNIIKVFSPEHGFRGDGDAGAKINDAIDAKTGLPIVSLYGKNKKPTKEQLKGVDIILFDLQDVGVRFYTYISTLHYILEAAGETNTKVIILDRPNPNAHIIDGPVLKSGYESFVGMHPIPVLYGMTIGEYGKMTIGEHWLPDSLTCDLTVVKIKNYTHETPYSIPIPPSPNLRNDNAIKLYPSLCFFEGTVVSVGRGTTKPFEIFGHPDMKSDFSFTPTPQKGATDPKLKNIKCFGVDLSNNNERFKTLKLDYLFQARDVLYPIYKEKWIDRKDFFNLLAGNDQLYNQLNSYASEEEIRKSWKNDLINFKKVRENYLIYE